MFLFSGRGYWQELIESIIWAHNKLKVSPIIQPRALSITQGRAVGVAHYLLGGIATTWSFFLARIISVGLDIQNQLSTLVNSLITKYKVSFFIFILF
jgi:photosystem I P700 chlorophyll a apoprotein A1